MAGCLATKTFGTNFCRTDNALGPSRSTRGPGFRYKGALACFCQPSSQKAALNAVIPTPKEVPHAISPLFLRFLGRAGLQVVLRGYWPRAAQRGGDDGAYHRSERPLRTSERYVDVTERVRELASGDQPFLVHNDTLGTDPDRGPRENTAH